MNGSDALNNPDGDGFDVNNNGKIESEEAFVNWMEYHIKSDILLYNSIQSGIFYPDNHTSSLPHHSWQGLADESFGERTGEYYLSLSNRLPTEDIGSSDPLSSDSDNDGMPDGWEYCYSVYGEFLPVNDYRWSMNPINPLDINYDPDADGWYDRQFNDQPATQGKWENRQFTPLATENQISNGVLGLYFSNLMEYNNGTHPLDADSDESIKRALKVATPPPESVNVWVPLIIIAAFILGFIGFRRIRDSISGQMPF